MGVSSCHFGTRGSLPCGYCEEDCAHYRSSVPSTCALGKDTFLPCFECGPGCVWYPRSCEIATARSLGRWPDGTSYDTNPFGLPLESVQEMERASGVADSGWDPGPDGSAEEESAEAPSPKVGFSLSEAQAAVVDHLDGPALVVSGAGSGKTSTVTRRIVRLCERGVHPERILGLTFTRKAAREMRERIAHSLPSAAKKVTLITFHSLGLLLCREFPTLIGRRPRFGIWDDKVMMSEMRRILRELTGSDEGPGEDEEGSPRDLAFTPGDPRPTPASCLKILEMSKEAGHLEIVFDDPTVHDRSVQKAAVLQYERTKISANVLDYTDLVWSAFRLLSSHPEVREIVQQRWTHLMVDEYQDTNDLQERLLQLLIGPSKNLVVVGDEDQCVPEDEVVWTDRGRIPIRDLPVGRSVRSSSNGQIEDCDILRGSRTLKRKVLAFKTETGRAFRVTPEHVVFAALDKPVGWYVYLMYRPKYGFRIGCSQSTGEQGLKSVRVRTTQEHAERLWILGTASSPGEAHLKEHTFAYRFRVPMAPFVPREGTMFSTPDQAIAFFSEFSKNGFDLLSTLGLDFDRPAYQTKASRTGTIVINLVIGSRAGADLGCETSAPLEDSVLERFGFSRSKSDGHRLRVQGPVEDLRQRATDLALAVGGRVVETLALPDSDRRLFSTRAAGLFPGMRVPVVLEDGRVSTEAIVERVETDGEFVCRDLQIAKNANFVIGDGVVVHNSIYAFRGSNADHIRSFTDRYEGARVYPLGQNYRSVQAVVRPASNVITFNENRRSDKKIWTENPEGEPLCVRESSDQQEEAVFIAQTLMASIASGRRPEHHVVLARTRRQFTLIQSTLRSHKVAYVTVGGIDHMQRPDIRRVLSWFRLFASPLDVSAGAQVLGHWPKLGAATVQQWSVFVGSTEGPVFARLDQLHKQKGLGVHTKKGQSLIRLQQVWADFNQRIRSSGDSIRDHAKWLYKSIGVDDEIDELLDDDIDRKANEEGQSRMELRQAFLDACPNDRITSWGLLSILAFLDAFLLSASDSRREGDKVVLSTIHGAKGLEWPVVFVAGAVEGLLPHSSDVVRQGDGTWKARLKPDEIEEERRLMYVAMTRARDVLYLSWFQLLSWPRPDGEKKSSRSRFLAELDATRSERDSRSAMRIRGTMIDRYAPRPADTPEQVAEKQALLGSVEGAFARRDRLELSRLAQHDDVPAEGEVGRFSIRSVKEKEGRARETEQAPALLPKISLRRKT